MPKKFDSSETIALIKRASAGDHGACTEIYTRYVERVRITCHRILKNKEDSEEVVQDIFSTVNQQIKKFKRKSSLSTWIFRIAFNCCMMNLRRRQENLVELEEASYHIVTDHDQEMVPNRMLLRQLIAGLEPLDRAVVEMRLLGYSHEEISDHYGKGIGFSKSRYIRAMIMMKKAYAHKRMYPMRNTVRAAVSPVA